MDTLKGKRLITLAYMQHENPPSPILAYYYTNQAFLKKFSTQNSKCIFTNMRIIPNDIIYTEREKYECVSVCVCERERVTSPEH